MTTLVNTAKLNKDQKWESFQLALAAKIYDNMLDHELHVENILIHRENNKDIIGSLSIDNHPFQIQGLYKMRQQKVYCELGLYDMLLPAPIAMYTMSIDIWVHEWLDYAYALTKQSVISISTDDASKWWESNAYVMPITQTFLDDITQYDVCEDVQEEENAEDDYNCDYLYDEDEEEEDIETRCESYMSYSFL